MIAVLGLGSIGLRHARNLLALGETVMGFDPSPERRALLEAEGGQTTASQPEALSGARAAVVASPSQYHQTDLAAALAAGCHVFAEKPLAHHPDGLGDLLDSADTAGLVVFAALNLRYHPAVVAAKALLDEGRLGQVLWARVEMADYLPNWRPGTDHTKGYANDPRTGGVIFDIVHEFDLAAHLLGLPEVKSCVARNTGTLGLESEDLADMVLAHPGGAQSSVHIDYVTRPRRRVTELAGTGGRLRMDLDARRLTLHDVSGTMVTDQAFPGAYADDYMAEMRAFLACTHGQARPLCDGREALAVLERLLSARELAGLPS
ncbi:MAG: Gfo/Idh/MocA family oxidoreductase [Rhodospirillaceae bacterium]|nr:Gfo/Idh/MocA family oxidoreductase [Rhodospirillales bacterium]